MDDSIASAVEGGSGSAKFQADQQKLQSNASLQVDIVQDALDTQYPSLDLAGFAMAAAEFPNRVNALPNKPIKTPIYSNYLPILIEDLKGKKIDEAPWTKWVTSQFTYLQLLARQSGDLALTVVRVAIRRRRFANVREGMCSGPTAPDGRAAASGRAASVCSSISSLVSCHLISAPRNQPLGNGSMI